MPAQFASDVMLPAASPPTALPAAGPPPELPPTTTRTLPRGKGTMSAARTKRCTVRSVSEAARSPPRLQLQISQSEPEFASVMTAH
jgi:hypothetical protein